MSIDATEPTPANDPTVLSVHVPDPPVTDDGVLDAEALAVLWRDAADLDGVAPRTGWPTRIEGILGDPSGLVMSGDVTPATDAPAPTRVGLLIPFAFYEVAVPDVVDPVRAIYNGAGTFVAPLPMPADAATGQALVGHWTIAEVRAARLLDVEPATVVPGRYLHHLNPDAPAEDEILNPIR